MIGSRSLLLVLLVLFALSKTTKALPLPADIGGVSEVSGYAQIRREESPFIADLKFSVQSNDEAVTSNGRMAITFLDDSTVKLTEHSQLTIDEYIFDPDPSKSKDGAYLWARHRQVY
jgi:hypothetical protein